MAPLEHHPVLANQSERPLLQTKLGAFFYDGLRPFGMPAVGSEDRDVGIDPQRIIPPMTGNHHPPVKVEDSLKLPPIERGDWAPVPFTRERRDDAQALFTFG
jgi:hypothetical protein